TFPLDTTKTRLQIQGQKLDQKYAHLKYSGMIDALLQISRQEGFKALYSGISSAILRQATYGTIKFGTYYSLKKAAMDKWETDDLVVINVVCAALAGAISSAIANPTDVVKVRMQVTGSNSNLSLFGCFQDVYQHEGISGLWRGVGPTAQRAAIIAAVELPIYDYSKNKFMILLGDSTFKNEGFLALYKGFVPTWFRMGPWNIIFFITYEQLKQLHNSHLSLNNVSDRSSK
ncbi:unnamed protein product, partial [Heterotrigona itama]